METVKPRMSPLLGRSIVNESIKWIAFIAKAKEEIMEASKSKYCPVL
jgi:hypothetical protein